MSMTILNIFLIVFCGLLFSTLFGFVLVLFNKDRDLMEQFTEENIRNKERTRAQRIEVVSRAVDNYRKANDIN